MNNMTWARSKRIKGLIEHGTGNPVNITELAAILILAANEQKVSLDDVVKELIQANEFNALPRKVDVKRNLKELGF